MKSGNKLVGTTILMSIAASLCCIAPLIALIAGTSSAASSFSWLEPARPYLIGLTILVLGYAWYEKLKPQKKSCCNIDTKGGFMQSKKFLGIVTIFSLLMLTLPMYSNLFYSKNEKQAVVVDPHNISKVEFLVNGMTCTGCEDHINHEVNKLDGIVNVKASYEKGNTVVEYDKTKLTVEQIEQSINSTGYKVVK